MTFRQRIALDRGLALPLCRVANVLARLAGWLLRRNHTVAPEATRTVVVAKLVGMGSIIQVTPLLRALRTRHPQARLVFLTLRANRTLVERLGLVDEILCLDDASLWRMGTSTLSVLWQLMRRRVDHYFDLELYSGFAALLSLASLARNRFGFYRHTASAKKGIYTHLVYFNTRMAVRRLYLQLGAVAGASTEDDELGTIHVLPAARTSCRAALTAAGLAPEARYILVNPNASDLLIERRWPVAHVVAAIARLVAAGHDIVLMGAPNEMTHVAHLHAALPPAIRPRVFPLAGKLSLDEVFALIEGAACVLSNDTGPMHMAFALRRPMVCLFGPVDPAHYGMTRPNIVTLYAPVPCSPCVHEIDEPPCGGDNICMQRLQPEVVVTHVLALLTGQPAPAPAPLPLVWQDSQGRPLGLDHRHSVKGSAA